MVTLPRLALRTLGRGKGRMALSVVILLSAVLLLTDIRLQYVSLQEDLYLEALSPWDYSIADASAATTYQRYNEHNQGITQAVSYPHLGKRAERHRWALRWGRARSCWRTTLPPGTRRSAPIRPRRSGPCCPMRRRT